MKRPSDLDHEAGQLKSPLRGAVLHVGHRRHLVRRSGSHFEPDRNRPGLFEMQDDADAVSKLKGDHYHGLITQAQYDTGMAAIRATHNGLLFDFWNIH